MAKTRTSSPKSSGGSGFDFERDVASWWALHLLAARLPHDEPGLGPPRAIRLQANVDGWTGGFDDIVVEVESADGGCVRFAVSARSSHVILANRAPKDFVLGCWQRHLNPGETQFDASGDRLVLATSTLPSMARKAVDDAVARAIAAPEDFERRVKKRGWLNRNAVAFSTSLSCPKSLWEGRTKSELQLGSLVRAVRVHDYDFLRADSASSSAAMEVARTLVRTGRLREARRLWTELRQLVEDVRPNSGVLTLTVLLDRLRGVVDVREYPEYEADWRQLNDITASWLAETRCVIGSSTTLRREELVRSLADELSTKRAVVLIGDVGSGKSALVKSLFEDDHRPATAFAVRAEDLLGLAGTNGAQLSYRLADILAAQTAPLAVLAIDAVDRLADETSLRELSQTIRALLLSDNRSPWRLILTCRSFDWERIRHHLAPFVPADLLTTVKVGPFSKEQLRFVVECEPALAFLLASQRSSPLVGRPQVLHLLVSAAVEGKSATDADVVGEAALIDWCWQRFIEASANRRRAKLLMDLARQQADDRRSTTALPSIPQVEPDPLPELQRLGILSVGSEVARFCHDTYGDWARQRYLLGEFISSQSVDAIVERIDNPLWHPAVRLLATHFLETELIEGEQGAAHWQRLVEFLGKRSPPCQVGVDLALESVIRHPRPDEAMDTVRHQLLDDEGTLLRALLARFRLTATRSDPRLDSPNLSLQPDEVSRLKIRARVPNLEFEWVSVLRWIAKKANPVLTCAPQELLEIAEPWLELFRVLQRAVPSVPTPPEILHLESMLLALSERMAAGELVSVEVRRLFALVLPCTRSQPDRVVALFSRFPHSETAERLRNERLRSAEESLVQVVSSPSGVDALLALGAKQAKETFLRLAQKRPGTRPHPLAGYAFRRIESAEPPFIDFHLMRALLNAEPELGIEFAIEVVGRETAAWSKAEASGRSSVPSAIELLIDGRWKPFVGDDGVLEWKRGHVGHSHFVSAVLMTLEAWLYDAEIDDLVLTRLLRGTKTAAIVGVLFDLALKKPALLLGPLEPLITSPWLFMRSLARPSEMASESLSPMGPLWMGPWLLRPRDPRIEQVQDWHEAPHRLQPFHETVAQLFTEKSLKWPVLERARRRWKRSLKNVPPGQYRQHLEELVWLFESKNWTPQDDAGTGYRYRHPQPLGDRQAEQAAQLDAVRALVPLQCRQIIVGTLQFDEAALEDLLRHAESTPLIERDSDPFDADQPWSIRCGAAAVAVIRYQGWLKSNSGWALRCREWLIEACRNPPAGGLSRDSKYGWRRFCADAIPLLWIEDQNDPSIRRALLFLMAQDKTTLLRRLVHLRTRAPDDFSRFMHIEVLRSRAKIIMKPISLRDRPDAQFDVDVAMQPAEQQFIERTLPPLPDDWPRLATGWPSPHITRPPALAAMKLPDGFAESSLLWSFSWLEDATKDSAPADRARLHRLVCQLSKIVTAGLRKDASQDKRFRRSHVEDGPNPGMPTPTTWSAALLVTEHDPRLRQELMEPWMTLPRISAKWTSAFLDDVHKCGLDGPEPTSQYLAAMRELHARPEWQRPLGEGEHWLDAGDVARSLLGVPSRGLDDWRRRWDTPRQSLATQLSSSWATWASVALSWYGCARALIDLLLTPACRQLRTDGILWLLPCASRPLWPGSDERDVDPLVTLLELIWTDHRDELASLEKRKAFDALLALPVKWRNARAILLQQRIAGRS